MLVNDRKNLKKNKKLALDKLCANSIFQEFVVFQEPQEFFPLFLILNAGFATGSL